MQAHLNELFIWIQRHTFWSQITFKNLLQSVLPADFERLLFHTWIKVIDIIIAIFEAAERKVFDPVWWWLHPQLGHVIEAILELTYDGFILWIRLKVLASDVFYVVKVYYTLAEALWGLYLSSQLFEILVIVIDVIFDRKIVINNKKWRFNLNFDFNILYLAYFITFGRFTWRLHRYIGVNFNIVFDTKIFKGVMHILLEHLLRECAPPPWAFFAFLRIRNELLKNFCIFIGHAIKTSSVNFIN